MINNFPDLITGFDNKNQTNSELRPLLTSNVAFDWLFVCLFIYFLFVCFLLRVLKLMKPTVRSFQGIARESV